MTPEQFCYWLQGRVELLPDQPPSQEEWKMISDHLNLVFDKKTTNIGYPPTKLPNGDPVDGVWWKNIGVIQTRSQVFVGDKRISL